MGDHRISKEMIHPSVKEEIMQHIGDLSVLETEDKSSIVAAINSIKQGKIDKKLLTDSLGLPVLESDSIAEICNKIKNVENEIKIILNDKGLDVSNINNLFTAIDRLKGSKSTTILGETYTVYNNILTNNSISGTTETKKDEITTFLLNGSYRVHLVACSYNIHYTVTLRVEHKRGDQVLNNQSFDVTTDLVNITSAKTVKCDIPNIQYGDTITIYTKNNSSSSGAAGALYSIKVTCDLV